MMFTGICIIGTILADGEGNTDIDLSDYGTPGNFFKIKTDAKTDGISSMVWKYYGYPTLDDLYADVVAIMPITLWWRMR